MAIPRPPTAPSDERLLVSRDELRRAAARHGVGEVAAAAIWAELTGPTTADTSSGAGLRRDTSSFAAATQLSRTVKVLLYAGGVLVIGSYGWWAGETDFAAGALLALSLAYGAGFLGTALYARSLRLDDLAAVAVTVVAFYAPVCAFAVLRLVGFDFAYEEDGVVAFYRWIDGGWVWLELAAIATAAALYVLFRAPLLLLPLTLFVLFLAEDATARVIGIDDETAPETIGAVVLAFALLTTLAAAVLDYRGLRRHAFWPHVLAAAGVVVGLEFLLGEHSFELALVLAGAAFLAAGTWLGRVTYLVGGGVSLWVGITALAPSPIVLTVSGLGFVAAAIWLSLAQSPLRRWLQVRTLPAPQRD